jgi:AbrB family looped-hinge helix DNA binding protein
MKVTSKGQVTIPQEVREAMGIRPSETEVEFKKDDSGRWYLSKLPTNPESKSRFRNAHKFARVSMTTEEIMALTRD